jgi:hypothetical protein
LGSSGEAKHFHSMAEEVGLIMTPTFKWITSVGIVEVWLWPRKWMSFRLSAKNISHLLSI